MQKIDLRTWFQTLRRSNWGVALLAGLLTTVLFAVTLQTHINGGNHPYVTDVGELQNALPRWGTIHFNGYPFYSITGSLLVTLFRLIGIQPAMGASLVSLIWGSLTAVFITLLALELGAKRWAALTGTVAFAVSTSMWIDSSLAEVHSMTMMFIAAILTFAVRFDRTGNRRDLLWLAFAASQGVFHSRAVIGIIPAVALFIIPRWRFILGNIILILVISLIAPLLYLYLPLREWMGADWTFGNTSTMAGFTRMFLNAKAGRFVSTSVETTDWSERIRITLSVLNDDLPLALLAISSLGFFTIRRPRPTYWRYTAALLLAVIPYMIIPAIIYGGFVGDAILAAKVPASMFAGLGLSLLLSYLYKWRAAVGYGALAVVVAAIGYIAYRNYPKVMSITQDRGVEEIIAIVDQAADPAQPTVLMMLWGHDYWGTAYAQKYRGQLQDVTLVDHNADLHEFVTEGYRLLTPGKTFFLWPVERWEEKLGPVYLDSYAPGLVEILTAPHTASLAADAFSVNSDLAIQSAAIQPENEGQSYLLQVNWYAKTNPERDYHLAIHLLANNPPTSPDDMISQADESNPIEGWYPTSQWVENQLIQGAYRLPVVDGKQPVAIRITAYYQDDDGQFVNGNWFIIPLPLE
ncbi:MAG: DUF2723 domain-containing protein [Chloroflexi bacterium]|nr:DUF2723 domain-containing protein [Chloroflexota bacterium]